MASPPPRDPRAESALLLVGPGPRAAGLARVLAVLATESGVEVRAFDDVAELASEPLERGLLLLDADATPLEDAGYVRRFLSAHPRCAAVVLGADGRGRTARALGLQRFAPWPPDVEELAALVAAAGGRASDAAPTARRAARTESDLGSPSSELDEVRAILAAEEHSEKRRERDETEPGGGLLETEILDGLDEASIERGRGSDLDDGPRSERAPLRASADERSGAVDREERDPDAAGAARGVLDAPPWWRAQVADLADTAQRIELSLERLADAAPDIDEGQDAEAGQRFTELGAEVARLLQFTRTLGYVAAPPAAGAQTFDFGEMVHVFAANLASSGPDAPRCQFKTTPGADVRSDRQLLSQALDAVFFLVRCTSHKGELVRAQVLRVEDEGRAAVELALDFPSGPLEGFAQDEIVAPYALTDLFPELGPNALAAATGIVAGQGGRLALENRARGRMTWRLSLPRARG